MSAFPSPPSDSGLQQLMAYDALAKFYERHWGRTFLESSIRLFQGDLIRHMRSGDPALELCCDTGHFAHWLAEKGHEVTGIDGSSAMPAHARRRIQPARFIPCDVRSFCLPQRLNAAVCLDNGLKQFLEPNSLRAVLASAYSHLKPGGLLLFDNVLEHGYKDASAHRRPFLFCERPHSIPVVTEALSHAGFDLTTVQLVRAGMPPDGRVSVLARRPPQSRTVSEFSGERIIDDE